MCKSFLYSWVEKECWFVSCISLGNLLNEINKNYRDLKY